MMNSLPVNLILGASPPPDHLSFHTSTLPVALGLPILTSHHDLVSLLDFSLMDVTSSAVDLLRVRGSVNFVNFNEGPR